MAARSALPALDGQGLANTLTAVSLLGWAPDAAWKADFWSAVLLQVARPLSVTAAVASNDPHRRSRQRARGTLHGRRVIDAGAAAAASQQPLCPGLAARSWEQLLDAQRRLGWQLPLQQLQALQEQGQLHRLTKGHAAGWMLRQQLHPQLQPQDQQQHMDPCQEAEAQEQLHATPANTSAAAAAFPTAELRALTPVRLPLELA